MRYDSPQRRFPSLHRPFFSYLAVAGLIALSSAGCGAGGSYELRWTVGCETTGDTSCTITSAKGCSSFGLDAIEVYAIQGFDEIRTLFPCFSMIDGAVGKGPELAEGAVTLHVSGLSAGGQLLTSGDVAVDIPSSDFQLVHINLSTPPPCDDGVDNDFDGLVDVHDPGCEKSGGEREEE